MTLPNKETAMNSKLLIGDKVKCWKSEATDLANEHNTSRKLAPTNLKKGII